MRFDKRWLEANIAAMINSMKSSAGQSHRERSLTRTTNRRTAGGLIVV
jgi:hypothetical protein